MLNLGNIDIETLIDLYHTNNQVHEMVLESATRLGKTLKSLINVLDIGTVVLNGRVTLFGEEYIAKVREETDKSFKKSNVVYSNLMEKGQLIGGATIGIDYILKKSLEK